MINYKPTEMSAYEQLEFDFGFKVKELQEKCPHTKKKWFESWWAVGHSNGEVLICLRCNKQLKRKNTLSEHIKKMQSDKIKKCKKHNYNAIGICMHCGDDKYSGMI